jgi:hypothetical protein
VTVGHTEVRCRSVAGWGDKLAFRLTVMEQSSPLTPYSYAYAIPKITSIEGPAATAAGVGVPLLNTAGNEVIVVKGANFGTKRKTTTPKGLPGVFAPGSDFVTIARQDVALFYGRTSGFENRALECEVTVDHVQMECRTAPGMGTNHTFQAVVGTQSSVPTSTPSTMRSYRPPELFAISGPGSKEASTVGGQEIYLQGNNFGPAFMGIFPTPVQVEATYGPGHDASRYTASGCQILDDHKRIRCLTSSGVGKDHLWKITVGAQTSALLGGKEMTSYAAPSIAEYKGLGTSM